MILKTQQMYLALQTEFFWSFCIVPQELTKATMKQLATIKKNTKGVQQINQYRWH